MTDYLSLAVTVGQIARRAGAEILKIYETEDFGVEQKADDSPLTRADKAANDVIERELSGLEFQAPILSEEGRNIPYAERVQWTRFWLVDPLDGTKEFIKRNGEFTVNIALIENQKTVIGVVYVPVTDELFYSVAGTGAFIEDATRPDNRRRIAAATFTLEDPRLKVVASRSHLSQETKDYLDRLNEPEMVQRGSSLKIVELARGKAHLYPRLGPTMEWDTGAAHAILKEAGGKLVDETTGKELLYNKENLLNNFFIAYGAVTEGPMSC